MDIEDKLEEAFWHFNGRRNGYGEWKKYPQSERDAFKHEFRLLFAEYRKYLANEITKMF